MSSSPIIITESRPSVRIVDCLLTLIAWGGFIYLIVHEFQTLFSRDYIQADSPARILLNYFYFALVYVFIFLLWAKYNQLFFSKERRKRKEIPNKILLAKSFDITISELEKLESHRVIKVYHHSTGEIKQSEIIDISPKP